MSGWVDRAKGRVKEAVGDLTDNDNVKREGRVDKVAGKAKDVVDDVKDKIQDKVADRR